MGNYFEYNVEHVKRRKKKCYKYNIVHYLSYHYLIDKTTKTRSAHMDILEVLNYLAEKYSFDEDDMSLIDEITNQIVNGEYEDDKYEDDKYEDEYEDKDIAEEDY